MLRRRDVGAATAPEGRSEDVRDGIAGMAQPVLLAVASELGRTGRSTPCYLATS